MAYRFLLAVLDKEGHATDKFEVIDFNYTNKFDPHVMKMNFGSPRAAAQAVIFRDDFEHACTGEPGCGTLLERHMAVIVSRALFGVFRPC